MKYILTCTWPDFTIGFGLCVHYPCVIFHLFFWKLYIGNLGETVPSEENNGEPVITSG